MPVIPVRRDDRITLMQRGNGTDRHGLLADIKVAEAFDFGLHEGLRRLLFEAPDENHFAEQVDALCGCQGRQNRRGLARFLLRPRLLCSSRCHEGLLGCAFRLPGGRCRKPSYYAQGRDLFNSKMKSCLCLGGKEIGHKSGTPAPSHRHSLVSNVPLPHFPVMRAPPFLCQCPQLFGAGDPVVPPSHQENFFRWQLGPPKRGTDHGQHPRSILPAHTPRLHLSSDHPAPRRIPDGRRHIGNRLHQPRTSEIRFMAKRQRCHPPTQTHSPKTHLGRTGRPRHLHNHPGFRHGLANRLRAPDQIPTKDQLPAPGSLGSATIMIREVIKDGRPSQSVEDGSPVDVTHITRGKERVKKNHRRRFHSLFSRPNTKMNAVVFFPIAGNGRGNLLPPRHQGSGNLPWCLVKFPCSLPQPVLGVAVPLFRTMSARPAEHLPKSDPGKSGRIY